MTTFEGEAVAAGAEAWLDLLTKWIAIPSVSADPAHRADVRASAEFLAAAFREAGFPEVEVLADGPYQPTDADKQAIRTLLDDRARAVEDGDEQAFLATVDPTDDDLVAEQRTLFANLTQLPVASVDYALDKPGICVTRLKLAA